MISTDALKWVNGNDFDMNMLLWAIPAAMEGEDLSGPCQPGGLVDRMIQAGREA